eukprot:gene3747-5353_t
MPHDRLPGPHGPVRTSVGGRQRFVQARAAAVAGD